MDADIVAVVSMGKIVEQGAPQQLLAQVGGLAAPNPRP